MRRLKKKLYLGLFGISVVTLAIIRHTCLSPSSLDDAVSPVNTRSDSVPPAHNVGATEHTNNAETAENIKRAPANHNVHKIIDVYSYSQTFPDAQDVQIVSARRHGVKPVKNRAQAERRKDELVFVGSNPFYKIDNGMRSSIPYLVPRAADLLQVIGRNFLDSLHVRDIPLHKILVSSVLRTEEDVARLMRTNLNASDQSCHRYGTTFDIPYNRYQTVCPPGEHRRTVSNDTLKWVLTQVLRDVRADSLCYIKYEVKQGCYHITVK